jgi:hypothetical protein
LENYENKIPYTCREAVVVFPFKRGKWVPPIAMLTKRSRAKDVKDPADEGTATAETTASNKYSAGNLKLCGKIIGNEWDSVQKDLLAASLAKSTWSTHSSAMNCYETFMRTTDRTLEWPAQLDDICNFVSWALTVKLLKAHTVRTYVSSLNTVHKLKKLESHCNDYVVQALIKGAENLELYNLKSHSARKVMTLPLLKVLGHQIAVSDWSSDSKITVWCACVVAFFGSFRFGEILSNSEFSYNPAELLMWQDIKFRKDGSVLIHVKVDKCKTVGGSFVDLFPFEGHGCCPIASLNSLKKEKFVVNKPVFMFANGKLLSQRILNSLIRQLLVPIFGKTALHLSGHSFRAGIASALASDPNIAMDKDIKCWGRWSSDSYLLYTRLKIQQKRALFEKIRLVLEK